MWIGLKKGRINKQQSIAYNIEQMERIRIRSMLNYLKKTQTVEPDLKLAEIQPKTSTDDSISQIISHSSKDNETENNHFHKFKSFTLDSSQLDLSVNAQTIDVGPPEELPNLVPVSEAKKKKTPIRCLAPGFCQRKRSYSQNLQELGIAKKVLTSRKSCHKYITNSNFNSQKLGKGQLARETYSQYENFEILENSQGKNVGGHRSKEKIIDIKYKQRSAKDQKKGVNQGQVRIRSIKCKEKTEKSSGNPEQQISPWMTQQQSTNLYYTLQ